MADVFVSYKKEDRPQAERLVDALRASGRTVWWDDGLTPRQAWDATIEREIEDAKAVVVLWSPRSVVSEWVRTEAHFAQENRKLVPVTIEPCRLPLAFALRQAVDLSGGIDPGTGNWKKLTGWLDELIDGSGEALTSQDWSQGAKAKPPAAPPPGWRKPFLAAGGLVAALALAFVAMPWMRGAAAQPGVVVDAFTTSPGSSLPASFTGTLQDEMFASFSASSRISPRIGSGERDAESFQLTGRADSADDTIRVFAQLFAPGIDGPILTAKFERPEMDGNMAAKDIGLALAKTVRCIATASDSSGARITELNPDALKGWAQFCYGTLAEMKDPASFLVTLQAVVAAEPEFANGWANLAEVLAVTAFGSSPSERSAQVAKAIEAADRAIELDPATPKAYLVKSWLVLPLFPTSGSDNFPAIRDVDGWEALATTATEARPSDCGCELIQYGFIMTQFGRSSAALPLIERGAMGQTGDWEADLQRAIALSVTGRDADAKTIFDRLVGEWPGVAWIRESAAKAAVWRKDWPQARALLQSLPESEATRAMQRLLAAKENGDEAAVRALGSTFEALARDPRTTGALTVLGLNLAGRNEAAVDAAERLLHAGGIPMMTILFEPSFAEARKTPEFARLVERTGIFTYWRKPGRQPDFCLASDAPALCRQFGKA